MNFLAINITKGEDATTESYESNLKCYGPWGSQISCEYKPFNINSLLVLIGFLAICLFICLIFYLHDYRIFRERNSSSAQQMFSISTLNSKSFQPNSGIHKIPENMKFGFWIHVPYPIPNNENSKSSKSSGNDLYLPKTAKEMREIIKRSKRPDPRKNENQLDLATRIRIAESL